MDSQKRFLRRNIYNIITIKMLEGKQNTAYQVIIEI